MQCTRDPNLLVLIIVVVIIGSVLLVVLLRGAIVTIAVRLCLRPCNHATTATGVGGWTGWLERERKKEKKKKGHTMTHIKAVNPGDLSVPMFAERNESTQQHNSRPCVLMVDIAAGSIGSSSPQYQYQAWLNCVLISMHPLLAGFHISFQPHLFLLSLHSSVGCSGLVPLWPRGLRSSSSCQWPSSRPFSVTERNESNARAGKYMKWLNAQKDK